MTKIKNWILIIITFITIYVLYINFDSIIQYINDYYDKYLKSEPKLIIKESNQYSKKDTFNFVMSSEDYIPHNKQDLINIFYSALNNGWDEFTFYCPPEYGNCYNDMMDISDDRKLLDDINNFVSPLNSYKSTKMFFDPTGEITIKFTHVYSDEEKDKLYNELVKIVNDNTNEDMDLEYKVLMLHNYIINNTKYDEIRLDEEDDENTKSPYDSSRIGGVLYDHYAICGGYADTMAVMLDILGIKNYRISSNSHVWNALYINDKWLHLDVTWDDPISTSGNDVLIYDYYLKDNKNIKKDDSEKKEHSFNNDIYSEMK